MAEQLRFHINDVLVEEDGVSPTTTLLQYLRQNMHLTGTKEGCAEGDCGACTVILVDPGALQGPMFRAVNSCLLLLPMLQGKQIYTVEGLQRDGKLHPAQAELVEKLGSQCGYCTPGVVMSMFEACYRQDLDEAWKIDDQMCGNLCRCTGYRPIREATQAVVGIVTDDHFSAQLAAAKPQSMALDYAFGEQRFINPVSFDELFDALDAHPDAVLVNGGTDLSLRVTKGFEAIPKIISLEGISALRRFEEREGGWEIGASLPLTDLERMTATCLPSVARMLRFFGARQIKHRGTAGGNICNASPIGDLPPIFLALGATLRLRSRQGLREVPIEEFFLSYRKTALRKGEILDGIWVPSPSEKARIGAYKVSKRRELDISAVAAGLFVEVDDAGIVQRARLAYGGMAATPARAALTEAALIGSSWTEARVEEVIPLLKQDFRPMSDHRGSAWYRSTVAANLLRGFFLETQSIGRPCLPQRPSGTVQTEVSS